MKKNKMMRLASAMMVMTLMTTSVISGTFAKYVSQTSASDNARVAKWGVTLSANGLLYSEMYKNLANGNVGTNTDTSVSVQTYNYSAETVAQSVVAPGTKNPGTAFTFTVALMSFAASLALIPLFTELIWIFEPAIVSSSLQTIP